MVEIPSATSIGRTMTLIYLVGAARADATPEQVLELKTNVDRLREPEVSMRDIAERVFEIMGPEWAPAGEWLAAIDAMRGGDPR